MKRGKAASSIMLLLLELGLLGFTANHTLNLLSLTLPPSQTALAWFGLLAFDAGLPVWTIYALYGARGGAQRGISLLMILISLAGVLLSFGADMALQAEANGLAAIMTADTTRAVVYALVLVIGANLAATTALHIFDPARLAEADEEAADSMIEAEERKAAAREAKQLAAALAPVRAAARMEALQARYLSGLPEPLQVQFRQAAQARLADQVQAAARLANATSGGNLPALPPPPPQAETSATLTSSATSANDKPGGGLTTILAAPEHAPATNGNGNGHGTNGHAKGKAKPRQ